MALRLMLPYAEPRRPQWGQVGELVDCTDDPFRYGEMFLDMWATQDDFVLIEHDLVVGMSELLALVQTRELATIPYYLHYERTMHAGPEILSVYSDRRLHTERTSLRCQRSGLGCVYIPYDTPGRRMPLELPAPEWGLVDTWICDHFDTWDPDPYPWRTLWLPIEHLPCLPGTKPETVNDPDGRWVKRWVTVTT